MFFSFLFLSLASYLKKIQLKIDLYLGLKDLLANFKHPSLCDLKMGRRTYAPDSSPSKIMIECAKYKWREEIGFLVTGLKVRLVNLFYFYSNLI